MNEHMDPEGKLRTVLKDAGLKKTSDEFSVDLTRAVLDAYGKDQPREFAAGQWLGKMILTVLVLFNVCLLVYFGRFRLNPEWTVSIVAFVAGAGVAIGLLKKYRVHSMHSGR